MVAWVEASRTTRFATGDANGPSALDQPDHVAARGLPAFLAVMYGLPQSSNDNCADLAEPDPASELDCLRGVLAPPLLVAAEARSREVGVGADRVLIQWGIIDEDAYLRRLSFHTGIAIETFAEICRGDCLLPDQRLAEAANHGLLPLRQDGQLCWILAPRGYAARRLAKFAASYPALSGRFRLASGAAIRAFLTEDAGDALAHAAADGLRERMPALSAANARTVRPKWRDRGRVAWPAIAIIALMLLPLSGRPVGVMLALWFLTFAGLRLSGCLLPSLRPPKLPRLHERQLPVYSIVAALHREAASVAALMQAFDEFDYPAEKLDIILVIEPDDLETRAAIAGLHVRPHVQVIIAPAVGPRTKPKALNYALPFARGTFVAVFDAEDRPDADQLRAALDAFRVGGPDLACVQASLCIDNGDDSRLARMFTAEYAGQFDVFLPALTRFGMPLPLGGSSNHFRSDALRSVGAWDAYNVTEDADLGVRLARFGYRSATFASTTYEEAPARFHGWLRQRSRWMKGWMQTWSVHMRAPRQLWRDAGPRGFFTLNLIVGGNVLTALVYPILLGAVMLYLIALALGGGAATFAGGRFGALHVAAMASGYLGAVAVGLVGLARRGMLRSGWVLALTPLYWICLSIAAWRALFQLIDDPYRWEKTEHGLARSSHRAKATARQQAGNIAKPAPAQHRRRNYR